MTFEDEDDVDIDLTEIDPALLESANALQAALLAHSVEDTEQLLKAGAPAWYQDARSGWGALHFAAEWGDERAVKAVLSSGGVWNAMDNLENTAGDIAISRNDEATYILIRDHGLRSELLLHLLSSSSSLSNDVIRESDASAAGSSRAFLSSRLTFRTDAHGQDICTVQAPGVGGLLQEVGVMMGWERRIMEETVRLLNAARRLEGEEHGLRILNIGFGLGIIDTLFQTLQPASHTIIEPHPDVLAHMQERGWPGKPGVQIRESRWQDVDLQSEGPWDVVYFDTFAEGYEELKEFFGLLPHILSSPTACFSFFNGLGATDALFYDVATNLADVHLERAGLNTVWHDVHVEADLAGAWGTSREYFRLEWYKLPICRLKTYTKP